MSLVDEDVLFVVVRYGVHSERLRLAKGGRGNYDGDGEDGGDAMAAPCRGHGSDLVVAAINSMDDEDTAKFVLKLEAVL